MGCATDADLRRLCEGCWDAVSGGCSLKKLCDCIEVLIRWGEEKAPCVISMRFAPPGMEMYAMNEWGMNSGK